MIEPKTVPDVEERAALRERDRIPVAGPWVTDLEVRYVAEAAANDWYTHAGESVGLFETEFADYLGTDFAAAVPHCTSALHLAMLALGLGPGDEVIVPESTWVATAAPVTYVGATPVFADIDADTWCLSPESLARCVSSRTAAIVTVDLYGGIPDMADRPVRRGRHSDHRGRSPGHRRQAGRATRRHAGRHRNLQLPRHENVDDR